uniref:Uncharacterized protein n=1 Tax=Pyricularia oryzae (strain P131) TaxID=1143193 RepID=L7J822_PYRO1
MTEFNRSQTRYHYATGPLKKRLICQTMFLSRHFKALRSVFSAGNNI